LVAELATALLARVSSGSALDDVAAALSLTLRCSSSAQRTCWRGDAPSTGVVVHTVLSTSSRTLGAAPLDTLVPAQLIVNCGYNDSEFTFHAAAKTSVWSNLATGRIAAASFTPRVLSPLAAAKAVVWRRCGAGEQCVARMHVRRQDPLKTAFLVVGPGTPI